MSAQASVVAPALSALGELFLNPPPADAGAVEAQREYARLFLGPTPAPACPPWQSLYAPLPEERRLMGAAHQSALAWYLRFGFEPAHSNEPADHVGLLLLFYAHLLGRGASESELVAFEREHLEWIPGFAEQLLAAGAAEPYGTAARALRELSAE